MYTHTHTYIYFNTVTTMQTNPCSLGTETQMENQYKGPKGLESKRSDFVRLIESHPKEVQLLFKE